jgi:hypothetical protein
MFSVPFFPRLYSESCWEAPRYAIFSIRPSPHPSSVQTSSPAPCSHTPSVYVPPLMSEMKFHTYTELFLVNMGVY